MRNVSGMPRDLKECAIRPWHWLCRVYLTSCRRRHHHHHQRSGGCGMHGIDPTISSALELALIIRNVGCVTGVAYCAMSVERWIRDRLVQFAVAPRAELTSSADDTRHCNAEGAGYTRFLVSSSVSWTVVIYDTEVTVLWGPFKNRRTLWVRNRLIVRSRRNQDTWERRGLNYIQVPEQCENPRYW